MTQAAAAQTTTASVGSVKADPLRPSGPSSPPFRLVTSYSSSDSSDSIIGSSSLVVVDCIFNRLKMDYELTQLPWLRAHLQLESGHAEAILPLIQQSDMDQSARLSAPFGLEKWYWFGRGGEDLGVLVKDKALRVGSLRGSNHALWLAKQGYSNVMEVESAGQLSQLLALRRVDAVFYELQWGVDTYGDFSSSDAGATFLFERYAALGMYVSNRVLTRTPALLERFNEQIAYCNPDWVALSETEARLIEARVYRSLSQRILSALHGTLITSDNAAPNAKEIKHLEKKWLKELKSKRYDLIDSVLNNAIKPLIERELNDEAGSVTEIIVTDKFGRNVFVSQPTSDYWQGDESKFRGVVSSGYKIYYGPMQFDASTGKFQTQISSPIFNARGEFDGVLVVGVDVVKALGEH